MLLNVLPPTPHLYAFEYGRRPGKGVLLKIFFVLKERLNEWKQDLVKEKNRLDLEREQLKQDRASLRADEQQLESLALNVKQRSQEISDITNVRAASIHLSCNRHSPGYGLPLFFSLFFV